MLYVQIKSAHLIILWRIRRVFAECWRVAFSCRKKLVAIPPLVKNVLFVGLSKK